MCVAWLLHLFTFAYEIFSQPCVVSHVWMRHVTHANESWHTYECVMSHIWMHHVTYMNITHMNESYHSCKFVMSHIRVMSHVWMSHVIHMNERIGHVTHIHAISELRHWVMSHIWMSHVTHMNEAWQSWHTYEYVTLHVCMSHGTHMHLHNIEARAMTELCHFTTRRKRRHVAAVCRFCNHSQKSACQ